MALPQTVIEHLDATDGYGHTSLELFGIIILSDARYIGGLYDIGGY